MFTCVGLFLMFFFEGNASDSLTLPIAHPKINSSYYGVFRCEDFILTHTPDHVEVAFDHIVLKGHAVFLPNGDGTGVIVNFRMSPQTLTEHLLRVREQVQISPEPLRVHLERIVPGLEIKF